MSRVFGAASSDLGTQVGCVVHGTLGISVVFAIYVALLEIDKRMDKGQLWKLFFDSPKTVGHSGRYSNVTVGNGRS